METSASFEDPFEVPDLRLKRKQHDKEDVQEIGDGKKKYKVKVVWANVIKFTMLHMLGLVGLIALPYVSLKTIFWGFITFIYSGLGVTAGAHRLWTHRSYKARFPLRLFLMLANTMATENSIYVWSRDHRTHHKFSETDADPHNAKRGFFFAHIGWLMCKKHPDVIHYGKKIDLGDLKNDALVMFQHQNYIPLALLVCFVIPTLIPVYFWNESFILSYLIAVVRYLVVLHSTWLVNSAAHMWGDRPYDVHINPCENLGVSLLAIGEGFHNYHHTFPHDYSASEWRYSFNLTTLFIDSMAWIGMAYGRRSVSKEVIKNRMMRTGVTSEKDLKGVEEEKNLRY